VAGVPTAHLHLYDKGEAREGRKMGHVNLRADDRDTLLERLVELRNRLKLPPLAETVD